MNYAWKYNGLNEPGNFYKRFDYRFSNTELLVIRHSPHKVRQCIKTKSKEIFDYSTRFSSLNKLEAGQKFRADRFFIFFK